MTDTVTAWVVVALMLVGPGIAELLASLITG